MRRNLLMGLTAALALGALAAMVLWRAPGATEPTSTEAEPAADTDVPDPIITTEAEPQPVVSAITAATVAPQPVVSATPAAPAHSDLPDEDTLMAKLHELGQNDPEQSIRLAREGNRRFPKSPGASERAWIVCKSLTNLARFDEARVEAQQMVKDYPGTSWTLDVVKHILIHPGTHPAQRGFGKRVEGE